MRDLHAEATFAAIARGHPHGSLSALQTQLGRNFAFISRVSATLVRARTNVLVAPGRGQPFFECRRYATGGKKAKLSAFPVPGPLPNDAKPPGGVIAAEGNHVSGLYTAADILDQCAVTAQIQQSDAIYVSASSGVHAAEACGKGDWYARLASASHRVYLPLSIIGARVVHAGGWMRHSGSSLPK